jgi:hypothetical protein
MGIDPSKEELMSVIDRLRADNRAKDQYIKERKKKHKKARERRRSADYAWEFVTGEYWDERGDKEEAQKDLKNLTKEHTKLQESHEQLQEEHKQPQHNYNRATKIITVEAWNKNFQRATDTELELITTQNDLKNAQKEIETLKGLVFTKSTPQFQFQAAHSASAADYTTSAFVQPGTDMSAPQLQTMTDMSTAPVQQDVEMQNGDVDVEDEPQMTECHKWNYGAGSCRKARPGHSCKDGYHTPKAVAAVCLCLRECARIRGVRNTYHRDHNGILELVAFGASCDWVLRYRGWASQGWRYMVEGYMGLSGQAV